MNDNLPVKDKTGFTFNLCWPKIFSECDTSPDHKEKQRKTDDGCSFPLFLIPFGLNLPNLIEPLNKKHVQQLEL